MENFLVVIIMSKCYNLGGYIRLQDEYEIIKGFSSNGKYLYIVMEHEDAHIMEEWEIRSMYKKWHHERCKKSFKSNHNGRYHDGRIVLGKNASDGKRKTY